MRHVAFISSSYGKRLHSPNLTSCECECIVPKVADCRVDDGASLATLLAFAEDTHLLGIVCVEYKNKKLALRPFPQGFTSR